MTPAEIERTKHIKHRLTLLDANRLRCVDCEQTVVIPLPEPPAPPVVAGSTSSTSSKHPLPLRHPDACTFHVGQRKATCSGCRADVLVEATRRTA